VITLPESLNKKLHNAWTKLVFYVSVVTDILDDKLSSKTDWEACEQQNDPITTQIDDGDGITDSDTTITVDSTDGFTIASADDPAYLIIEDEIIKYTAMDETSFQNCTRGEYGTTAAAHADNTTVSQLIFSTGESPDYDLQPQPRNWWRHSTTGAPAQRLGHGFVFRPADGCFYMFGGIGGGGNRYSDLWKLDPSTHTWTQLTPGGVTPTAVYDMAMIYNPDTDEIWVVGGYYSAGISQKVYKYSFSSSAWSTSGSWDCPALMAESAAVYDPDKNLMYVIGSSASGHEHKALSFDGSTWSSLTGTPSTFRAARGCYMTAEKKVMCLGCQENLQSKRNLIYDPASDSWESKSVMSGDIRGFSGVAYDEASQCVLVFGGIQYKNGLARGAFVDLWKYKYSADEWISLADYNFGSDLYGHHGFAWNRNDNYACAWGGVNDPSPLTWHTYDEPVYYSHRHGAVQVRTRTLDLGETPTVAGVWELEDETDLTNDSNSISYTAEYSDDASAWTPMGAISDGDEIEEKHRYYRVTVTFTTEGILAPKVVSINPSFAVTTNYSMASKPVNCYPPIVRSIKFATSKIDVLKNTASIGTLNITFMDAMQICDELFLDTYLRNSEVRVYLGVEEDCSVEDFILVAKGKVDSWNRSSNHLIDIKCLDFLGKLKMEIPEEETDGTITALVYDASGIAAHPVDILEDIIRNQVGIPDRDIDLDSFNVAKNDASIADWKFKRTISEPTDAQKLCLEICRHIGAVLIPRETGRLVLKILDASDEPVTTWDERELNFKDVKFHGIGQTFRNYISTWYGWDGSGDEYTNYAGAEVSTDATSVTNWGRKVLRTKSRWLGPDDATYYGKDRASDISERILSIAKWGIPVLSLTTNMRGLPVEIGDIIRIRSSLVRNQNEYLEWQRKHDPSRSLSFHAKAGRYTVPYLMYGCTESIDHKWWAIEKTIDADKGVIKWKLARAREAPLSYEYDTADDFTAGETDNTVIDDANDRVILDTEVSDVLDDCDSTSGWNYAGSATAPTLNSDDAQEGDYCFDMGANSTANAVYYKTLSSVYDATSKLLGVYFYATAAAVSAINYVELRLGVDEDNYYYERYYPGTDFYEGWNLLGRAKSGDGLVSEMSEYDSVGPPALDITNLQYVAVNINLNNTITHGDIKMDYWRLDEYVSSGTWTGTFDMGQQPEQDGEWSITSSGSISLKAWGSETGVFDGEQLPLGTITDGTAITTKVRYYRVVATLTSDPPSDPTAVLSYIKANFPNG